MPEGCVHQSMARDICARVVCCVLMGCSDLLFDVCLAFWIVGTVFPDYMCPVFCINTIREMSSRNLHCYYILLCFNPGKLTSIPCEYAELDGTSGNIAMFDKCLINVFAETCSFNKCVVATPANCNA